jgi:hypothetical protein
MGKWLESHSAATKMIAIDSESFALGFFWPDCRAHCLKACVRWRVMKGRAFPAEVPAPPVLGFRAGGRYSRCHVFHSIREHYLRANCPYGTWAMLNHFANNLIDI